MASTLGRRAVIGILGALLLCAFVFQVIDEPVIKQRFGAHYYCVPAGLVALSDRDFPDAKKSEYDTDPGSSFMKIEFPLDWVLRYAPEWQRFVNAVSDVGTPLFQHVSPSIRPLISLEGLKESIRSDRKSFPETRPIPDASMGMARLVARRHPDNGEPARWYFVHLQPDGKFTLTGSDWLWGSCSDWSGGASGMFECMRNLNTKELSIQYHIASQNLKYYPEIDRMILDQVEAWRCDEP
ncbi:hypothetical protein J5J83_18895 [Azoarcus sp. L1K30]|uniref:hypothetical protein n=1 Tax=Azoarcus sp. L1K30 TaxID=2820277 RepID=UPI001B83B963|nr:hypothetical protein [Azoarcus sp. L1K30]MBR0568193.1 hypothetical protein [Azoarcus sp. L1K30]